MIRVCTLSHTQTSHADALNDDRMLVFLGNQEANIAAAQATVNSTASKKQAILKKYLVVPEKAEIFQERLIRVCSVNISYWFIIDK